MKIDGNTANNTNISNANVKDSNTQMNKDKTSDKQENGNIFAGDLNLGTDIDNKRKQAQSLAINLIEKAFASDNAIDDEISSRKKHIDDLYTKNSEAQDMINGISAEQEVIKKGYDIADNSPEEEDLNLLRKEHDSFLDDSITLTSEEKEHLQNIHENGLTEYQSTMLSMDADKSIYKKTIHDNKKSIIEENAVIRGIHLERNKSHGMVDASKQADKVLDASNKEIIGMMMEDVKNGIDNKLEENKEKAEEKKAENEELEKRIEAAKAESDKTKKNDDQDEMYKLDDILNEVISKKQNSNMPDVKKSLTQIVNELKLTADDLKGAVVDEDI